MHAAVKRYKGIPICYKWTRGEDKGACNGDVESFIRDVLPDSDQHTPLCELVN